MLLIYGMNFAVKLLSKWQFTISFKILKFSESESNFILNFE